MSYIKDPNKTNKKPTACQKTQLQSFNSLQRLINNYCKIFSVQQQMTAGHGLMSNHLSSSSQSSVGGFTNNPPPSTSGPAHSSGSSHSPQSHRRVPTQPGHNQNNRVATRLPSLAEGDHPAETEPLIPPRTTSKPNVQMFQQQQVMPRNVVVNGMILTGSGFH